MIVVLEGSEAVGKSTLSRELVQLWDDVSIHGSGGSMPLHAGPPDVGRPVYPQYAEMLIDERFRSLALDPDWLIVLDRFHLGELLYGPLLRGGCGLDDEQLTHLELTLRGLGAFTLILSENADVIHERMNGQRTDLVDVDTAVRINTAYVRLAARFGWPTTHASRYPAGHLAQDVLGKARVLTEGAKDLVDHPGYVGSPAPMMLFAGDVPSGWSPGDPIRPAFYPGTGRGSASYLLRALESSRANVAYGLCNVNDGTDVGALWETLHRPIIVGLGRHAQTGLNQLGLTYVDMPHPQWVRRFKHQSLEEYGRDLFFGEPVKHR